MNIEYLRKSRNMPFIKRGMRVYHIHNGRYGRISGANNSGNLNITFDGDNYSVNCHPQWQMRYFDKDNNLIVEYKK